MAPHILLRSHWFDTNNDIIQRKDNNYKYYLYHRDGVTSTLLSHWFDANNIILFEESIVIINKIRLVGVALDVLLTLIGSIPIMK